MGSSLTRTQVTDAILEANRVGNFIGRLITEEVERLGSPHRSSPRMIESHDVVNQLLRVRYLLRRLARHELDGDAETLVQVGWYGPYGVVPGGLDVDPADGWRPVYVPKEDDW